MVKVTIDFAGTNVKHEFECANYEIKEGCIGLQFPNGELTFYPLHTVYRINVKYA